MLFGKQLLQPSAIILDYAKERGPYGMEVYLQMFVYFSKINPGILGPIKPPKNPLVPRRTQELTILY